MVGKNIPHHGWFRHQNFSTLDIVWKLLVGPRWQIPDCGGVICHSWRRWFFGPKTRKMSQDPWVVRFLSYLQKWKYRGISWYLDLWKNVLYVNCLDNPQSQRFRKSFVLGPRFSHPNQIDDGPKPCAASPRLLLCLSCLLCGLSCDM